MSHETVLVPMIIGLGLLLLGGISLVLHGGFRLMFSGGRRQEDAGSGEGSHTRTNR